MCGLVFLLSKETELTMFRHCTKAVAYRGQDEQNTKILAPDSNQLSLFHARFAITGGDFQQQPVIGQDFAFLFNGELYNAGQLAVHYFPTETLLKDQYGKVVETNLLLRLITDFWPERDLWSSELHGMFALVAYKDNEVWAVQDFWKMKPLYQILMPDNGVLFSSQPPKVKYSTQDLNTYLHFRYAPVSNKIGKEVDLLSDENRIRVQTLAPKPRYDYSVNTLDQLLKSSIEKHKCVEHKTGIFLSGGVDSTLLAAYNQELNFITGPAYTAVDSSKPITQDANYGKLAAIQYGLDWQPITVGPKDLLDSLPKLTAILEHPIADVAGLLTYLICQKAKQDGLMVLYSGAGADELFGGYQRHQALFQIQQLGFSGLLFALSKIPKSVFPKVVRPILQKIAGQNLFDDPALSTLLRMQLNWPKEVWKHGLPRLQSPKNTNNLSELDWLLAQDRSDYLPNQVLAITDRASMLAQVEVRLPYLDQVLSKWVLSFDAKTHLEKGPKYLMRQLLIGKGGAQYANRSKQGFGINLDAWLRSPILSPLLALINEGASALWDTLDKKQIQVMVKDHLSGKANYGLHLFSLITFRLWETT